MVLEVRNDLLFSELRPLKVMNISEISWKIIDFLSKNQWFPPKNVSRLVPVSHLGSLKFNCAILISRIESWGLHQTIWFLLSVMFIWLFIELSKQILFFLIFSSFFSWFCINKSRNSLNFLMYTPSAQLVMHKQYRITYYKVKDHEKKWEKTKSASTIL